MKVFLVIVWGVLIYFIDEGEEKFMEELGEEEINIVYLRGKIDV